MLNIHHPFKHDDDLGMIYDIVVIQPVVNQSLSPHLTMPICLSPCCPILSEYEPLLKLFMASKIREGVTEEASNLYFVGVPADPSAPSARAGTTGAKLPESTFGGMKSYTYAVAGDHDGVSGWFQVFSKHQRWGISKFRRSRFSKHIGDILLATSLAF